MRNLTTEESKAVELLWSNVNFIYSLRKDDHAASVLKTVAELYGVQPKDYVGVVLKALEHKQIKGPDVNKALFNYLTDAEKKIFPYLLSRTSAKNAAKKLEISESTFNTYTSNVNMRLNTSRNRVKLLALIYKYVHNS